MCAPERVLGDASSTLHITQEELLIQSKFNTVCLHLKVGTSMEIHIAERSLYQEDKPKVCKGGGYRWKQGG